MGRERTHVREVGAPALEPAPPRLLLWSIAGGCAAAALLLYGLTAAPDVTYTDAGELAACCVVWGVAHPTGYPLFTLLGRLWVLLVPFLPPIRALNLLAALWTALSVLAFFALCREVLARSAVAENPRHQLWVCAVVALTYATARTMWEQATAVEVYSLHLLLLWATLWAFFRAGRTGNLRWLLLGAYLFGLGLANHATTLLAFPALLWLLFGHRRGKLPLGPLAALTALALTLYLALPLRSAAAPPLDWGGVARSWEKFLYLVTGAQYRVWMFSEAETWKRNAALFFELLPWQLGLVGIVPLVGGFFVLWRRNRFVLGCLLLLLLGCLLYAFNYSIHDIAAYFVQAYGSLLLVAAAGIAALWRRQPLLRWAFLSLPVLNLVGNWRENDRSHDLAVSAYVRMVTELAEPNALILSSQWDFWCSAFWYKQLVEGVRPDIVLVEQELLRRTWYPEQLRRWYPQAMSCCPEAFQVYEQQLELFESGRPYDAATLQRAYEGVLNALIDAHIQSRPVYLTPDVLVREPAIAASYVKLPEGPLLRLSRSPDTLSARLATLPWEELVEWLRYRDSELDRALRETLLRSLTASSLYATHKGQQELARRLENVARHLAHRAP